MRTTEVRDEVREYGMGGMIAIVDHPAHGRLLIADGYGGEDQIRGGAVRWEHGMVAQLQPGDTLAHLDADWNGKVTLMDAVRHGHDDSRPVLDWHGRAIAALARAAKL